MTKRQKQLLDFIMKFWEENGYSPSYEEMAEGLGIASKSNVHRLVYSLVNRGFLKNHPNKSRSLLVVI
jgi:repressor LexA